MIENQYLKNLVRDEYSEIAKKHNGIAYFNEQQLLTNSDYVEVKYALNATVFDLEKAIYLHQTEKIAELEKQKATLSKKKNQLVKMLLHPQAEPQQECNLCFDKGTMPNGELCHCYYERITKAALDFLQLKQRDFNDFDDDRLSQINGEKATFAKMRSYAENFDVQKPSLLLLGNPGTGKTFLAQAIAKTVSQKNFNVIFVSAIELNRVLLNLHLAPNANKEIYYDILSTCDLLVIDDLGTEPIYKNVTLEYLLAVITERINAQKPFVITSNLTPENLLERYGERLYSRISSRNTFKHQFVGKDLRKQK